MRQVEGVRMWRGKPGEAVVRSGVRVLVALVVLAALFPPAPAVAQDAEEAVMVAAGEWVLARVPGDGAPRLDPHRSGAGKDGARVRRVARALGAEMATLDGVRKCDDVMDRSTCRLSVARLLAISPPSVEGDRARVKVYAWYRSDSRARPVASESWELELRRAGDRWRVVSGG